MELAAVLEVSPAYLRLIATNRQPIGADSIFNAFIMPFNMGKNYFKITDFVGNIGEATGDWRRNQKLYERIQGIVLDTRYLMYHYSGKPLKEKVALAECIEAVLGKPLIPAGAEALPKHKPVKYEFSSPPVMMVAEDPAPYAIWSEKRR